MMVKQSEVCRYLKAVRQSGLPVGSVAIKPDGTVLIDVGDGDAVADETDDIDALIERIPNAT